MRIRAEKNILDNIYTTEKIRKTKFFLNKLVTLVNPSWYRLRNKNKHKSPIPFLKRVNRLDPYENQRLVRSYNEFENLDKWQNSLKKSISYSTYFSSVTRSKMC